MIFGRIEDPKSVSGILKTLNSQFPITRVKVAPEDIERINNASCEKDPNSFKYGKYTLTDFGPEISL